MRMLQELLNKLWQLVTVPHSSGDRRMLQEWHFNESALGRLHEFCLASILEAKRKENMSLSMQPTARPNCISERNQAAPLTRPSFVPANPQRPCEHCLFSSTTSFCSPLDSGERC